MRSAVRLAFLVVALLLLPGCRQPDGPVPTPSPAVQEDLNDVTRDLQNIASGTDPQAPADLTQDLTKYHEAPATVKVVAELTRRTAGAVAGSALTEQAAQRLTHNLWLSVTAPELSERQIEGLQNDTQSILMSIGIAEARAQPVAAQVGEVQRAVTARARRWYELF